MLGRNRSEKDIPIKFKSLFYGNFLKSQRNKIICFKTINTQNQQVIVKSREDALCLFGQQTKRILKWCLGFRKFEPDHRENFKRQEVYCCFNDPPTYCSIKADITRLSTYS